MLLLKPLTFFGIAGDESSQVLAALANLGDRLGENGLNSAYPVANLAEKVSEGTFKGSDPEVSP